MKKRYVFTAAMILSMGLLWSISAIAGDKATEYLKKVDEMFSPGKDMTAVIKTVLISSDGSTEERKMKSYRKGEKKIFFFLSPAGVKGVAFLSLADDQMYLYMPAFKKVRRIASSSKSDNFMGTDMSYDDLAETSYSKKYSPKILSETDSEVVMELTAKPGADTSYGKMIITVDKKTWLRTAAKMYNKSGKLIKEMKASDIKTINGYPTPMVIEVKDVDSGHRTKMIIEDVKYDTGLKDSLFSKRKITRIK